MCAGASGGALHEKKNKKGEDARVIFPFIQLRLCSVAFACSRRWLPSLPFPYDFVCEYALALFFSLHGDCRWKHSTGSPKWTSGMTNEDATSLALRLIFDHVYYFRHRRSGRRRCVHFLFGDVCVTDEAVLHLATKRCDPHFAWPSSHSLKLHLCSHT